MATNVMGPMLACQPPRRLAVVAAVLSLLTVAFAPGGLVAAEPLGATTLQAIRSYVKSELAELHVPGAAVAIVHDDAIVFAEGFGIAQPDGTPVTPQTPFLISSVSKSLTAIAVQQQIQAGNLELDGRVQDYLPWFGAGHSGTAAITVRDLLAHTSGWTYGDGNVNRLDESDDDQALERNVRRLSDTPPTHPSGQFGYSTANYDVLGLLVQTVSAERYEDYMQRHIFDPLEMGHTFSNRTAAEQDGLATGYYPFFGISIPWRIPFVRSSAPSAFLYSSAEDLGHALIAEINSGHYGDVQILSPTAMDQMHEPLVHPEWWSGYAMGLWIYPLWDSGSLRYDGKLATEYHAPVILEHNGGSATYGAGILLIPQQRWGVAIVMNLKDEANPRYDEIHLGIADILLASKAPSPRTGGDLGRQAAKPIGLGLVLFQLVGIGWAIRKLRRWRRNPSAAPHSRSGFIRHLAVPLLLDLTIPTALWGMLLTGEQGLPPRIEILWTLPRWFPDIGLALLLITLLGVGWGLIRTVLSVRLLRSFA